jgi:ABC-type uncharacterized transport system fused permease/ATPase subunit
LENCDQRICSDIASFARETAALYGHSFKPALEFGLSLTAAAGQLGFSRPLALFGSQIFITLALRSLTPPLGKMVAREAELEGNLRAAHSRLIAHAEEVAFLRGADTERGILNSRLTSLISTQRYHNLQRIRRSVSENIGARRKRTGAGRVAPWAVGGSPWSVVVAGVRLGQPDPLECDPLPGP